MDVALNLGWESIENWDLTNIGTEPKQFDLLLIEFCPEIRISQSGQFKREHGGKFLV